MRVCTECQESKPVAEFYRRKRSKDGLDTKCKACINAHRRQWRDANRERINALEREARQRNPERVRASRKRYTESHRAEEAARKAEYARTHPEALRAKRQRYRQNYPVKFMARKTIYREIMHNRLPRASTMVCEVCGESLACHWHHHAGYEQEHWKDVIAVCKECHLQVEHRKGT